MSEGADAWWCRVGALPAALCTLSELEDLRIRGELPMDEEDDQVRCHESPRSLRMIYFAWLFYA